MKTLQTSRQLIEQLQVLPWQKNNQEESKILIKLLKLALLKDKKDFDELTQNMNEGVSKCKIICDQDGVPYDYTFLSVNKAFETQSGLKESEIIGRTILDIFPESGNFWIKFYGEVALTQQPNSITKYSSNLKRHFVSSAYSSTKGEFTMLFKDVTDKHDLAAANVELAKKGKQNSAVLTNMQEGFAHCEIICDAAGKPVDYRILNVNKAYEKQTGIKSKDIVGKTVLEFYPDIEKSWIEIYGKVALSRKPHSFVNFNHNTGKYYQTNAFSPEKGEFALFFRNITDQETKRMELAAAHQEIVESQERNAAVLANMQEAFSHCEIICDDDGLPIDYRFLNVNTSFESQTGIKADATLGKTILELFPDVEKSWIKNFGKVALTGEPYSFIDFNHNTNRYYQVNAFSPAKGEFAAFMRDITDQEIKRIELEEAYKKAEENEKLKSAFLANMSHEVRTPMNAILGFSSLLESTNLSNEDRKSCLENIKLSGNRLLTIISDILDISKIDAHQQKLVFSECDLNELLDNLFNQHTVLNTNSKIELKLEKGLKKQNCIISTDEIRLSQILSNLIENALKYTIKGEVVFGYTQEKKHLKFYVKDTGVGLQRKDQNIIFDRFAQVKNDSQPLASGSGLGISIASGLVTLFEGEMWVESEIEKGSCFYFTIPYIPFKEKIATKAHKNTILIAEDDDVNFLLLNLWLNSHFNVLHATNGFEAVQMFEEYSSIDLIIMDIRMPYLNGIQATEEIRKLDANIPIIAHTAFAMGEESILIKKAGCNLVLVKPITRDELLSVLAKFKITV